MTEHLEPQLNHGSAPSAAPGRATVWLWMSVPIALLGIASSLAGILIDSTYARETENWAGQAMGEDIANLVAYPMMVVTAFAASRDSLRAYLAWTGLMAYSVYAFAIYAFSVHFNRMFLIYVAVFGLSIYALIGGIASLDPARVRASFSSRAPVRSTSVVLIVIGSIFYLLWLAEVVGATINDAAPEATVEAGLLSNPVHVLDMAVLLPAAIGAGVLLLRRRAWGYLLAPTILGTLLFLSVGIVAAMLVLADRGLEAPVGVTTGVAVLTVIELVTLLRFLRAVDNQIAPYRPPFR